MIDEKKLIENLGKLAKERPYKQVGNLDSYREYNEAWQDCIDRVEQLINNQPKTGEWIPVTERKPELCATYFVSCRHEYGSKTFPAYYDVETDTWVKSNGFCHHIRSIIRTPYEITAWQPLSEPYGGEEE